MVLGMADRDTRNDRNDRDDADLKELIASTGRYIAVAGPPTSTLSGVGAGLLQNWLDRHTRLGVHATPQTGAQDEAVPDNGYTVGAASGFPTTGTRSTGGLFRGPKPPEPVYNGGLGPLLPPSTLMPVTPNEVANAYERLRIEVTHTWRKLLADDKGTVVPTEDAIHARTVELLKVWRGIA